MSEYTCEACGVTFDSERSEEDARAEAQELWQQSPDTDDMGVLCDDCFQLFIYDAQQRVQDEWGW